MRKRFVLRATTYEPLDLRTRVGRASTTNSSHNHPCFCYHYYYYYYCYVTSRKEIDVSGY